MTQLKVLDKKKRKEFFNKLETQFGIYNFVLDDVLFQNRLGRLYLVSRDIERLELSNIRVNSVGLYIGRMDRLVRLSIEGSQIFGPYAWKNVHLVDKGDAQIWMQGGDISIDKEHDDFVIVKHGDDFIGCGKYSKGKILNYVPKERRIKLSN